MVKWGKQGFLNPVNSDDSGWYKFSVRPPSVPKGCADSIGSSILFRLADCSDEISLDFWVSKSYKSKTDGWDADQLANTRKEIKERIKKIVLMRKVITEALDKFEQALLEADDKAAAAQKECQ